MKAKQLTAIKRIVRPSGKKGNCFSGTFFGTFFSADNGKFTATDSFSLVMFDNITDEELSVIQSDDSYYWKDTTNCGMLPKCTRLFDTFDNDFHSVYSDEPCRFEMLTLKEIEAIYKTAKEGDKEYCRTIRNGVCFNASYLRNICNALDANPDNKKVGVYYGNSMSPIVIYGNRGRGLLMPVMM